MNPCANMLLTLVYVGDILYSTLIIQPHELSTVKVILFSQIRKYYGLRSNKNIDSRFFHNSLEIANFLVSW